MSGGGMNRQGVRWLVVGLILGLAIGGGVAWATIPNSSTGEITACVKTSGTTKGAVRIIDAQAGAACAAGELRIS